MPTFVNDFDVILNKLKDQGQMPKSKKVKYDMNEQNIPIASLELMSTKQHYKNFGYYWQN